MPPIRARISISDERQLEVIEEVKADLESSPIVQALGQSVSDVAAVRYLLNLACKHSTELLQLEAGRGRVVAVGPGGSGGETGSECTTGSESWKESDGSPQNRSERVEPTVESSEAPAEELDEELDADLVPIPERDDLPEVYPRPPVWVLADDGEWDIPEAQRGMHGYYSKHGWVRGMAQLEDRVLEFYWTERRRKQGLKPWSGQDDWGRRMIVQKDPLTFGIAHLVPDDFGQERGETMITFGGV